MDKVNLLTIVCNILNKNKKLNVSLSKIETYMTNAWGDTYEVTFNYKNKPLTLYLHEGAFEKWNKVPWGGMTTFRPRNWDEWDLNDKLILTMCWCIYQYCRDADKGTYPEPPERD